MPSSAPHHNFRRFVLPGAIFVIVLAAALVWRLSAGAGTADAATYYLDSNRGNDAASGVSEAAAWRTLGKLDGVSLQPGDAVRLRAGSVWTEQLVIGDSGIDGRPITVGRYGKGSPPRITGVRDCVTVSGNWVAISGVHADKCEMSGFELHGAGDSVRYSRATRSAIGVFAMKESSGAVISRNFIAYNNRMYALTREPDYDDAGAFGVLLHGSGANVGYNTINGHSAFSYDFWRDGSAVEVYGATGSRIHHNNARNNHTFIELGLEGSADNMISRNTVTSNRPRQYGLVTRGGAEQFGPVLRTTFTRNKLRMTGRKSIGFVCSAGCGPDVLTMTYNTFDITGDGGFADHAPKMRGNRFLNGELDIESQR